MIDNGVVDSSIRSYSTESVQTGTPEETKEYCFELVVGVMRRDKKTRSILLSGLDEKLITQGSSRALPTPLALRFFL